MFILFIIVSVFIILLARHEFKKWINPCSLLSMIWIFVLLFYNFKLIQYDNISIKSYLIIILYNLVLSFGIMFGNRVLIKKGQRNHTNFLDSNKMYLLIIVTTILSALAIIPNLIMCINKYGFLNLLNSISDIYKDRESGGLEYANYFSPLIFISLMLIGYEVKKNRFKKIYFISILFALINSITFGGRNNIIMSAIFLLIPIFIDNKKRTRALLNLKNAIIIVIIMFTIIVTFNLINKQRSFSVAIQQRYISPTMIKLIKVDHSFYRTYQYFTEPIAYLNQYLNSPSFDFGKNTFHFAYKQLYKLEIIKNIEDTLPYKNVPVLCNVGTYITEIIMDFGIIGGLFIVFLFGCFTGYCRKKVLSEDPGIFSLSFLCFAYVCIFLSFFMWEARSTTLSLILIYSIILSFLIFTSNKSKSLYNK